MSTHLSHRDVERFRRAQQDILSLDHDRVEDWSFKVARSVKQFVRCDIAAVVLASHKVLSAVTEDFDPRLFASLEQSLGMTLDGPDGDPHLKKTILGTLNGGIYTFSARATFLRFAGRSVDGTQVYEDFMKPAGVDDGPNLQVPVPGGMATIAVAHSDHAKNVNGFTRELSLLDLLVPTFAAAARMRVQFAVNFPRLPRLFDQLDTAVLVCNTDGRELYRNRRLEVLIEKDPERARILSESRQLARSVAALIDSSRRTGHHELHPIPSIRINTSAAVYGAHAGLVGGGLVSSNPLILVSISCLSLQLPRAELVSRHYGLGRQETVITFMLAEGLSNKEIAKRLGIKPATVRTHAERIFAKLRVHSRKSLGLLLLRATESLTADGPLSGSDP